MHVHDKRPIEECFEKTKKPFIKVKWIAHKRVDKTQHECEVEAGGKADQHRQGTRLVRGDATARNFADAAISDGHWKQAQGVDDQRHELFVHARTGIH